MNSKKHLEPWSRCRACWQNSANLVSLNNTVNIHGDKLRYIDIIFELVHISVSENDGKPQSLCENCAKDVCNSYNFIQMFRKTNQMLEAEVDSAIVSDPNDVCVKTEFVSIDEVTPDLTSTNEINPLQIEYIDVPVKIKLEELEETQTSDLHKKNQTSNETKSISPITIAPDKKNNLLVSNPSNLPLHRTNEHSVTTTSKLTQIKILYRCYDCDYITDNNSRLKLHSKKHPKKKSTKYRQCSHCSFISKTTIDSHTKNEQAASTTNTTMATKNVFICSSCNKCYFSLYHLSLHRHYDNSKTDPSIEKKYWCDYCNFVAKNKTQITEHINLHANEEWFKCCVCKYCGACFKTQAGLNVHTKNKHAETAPSLSVLNQITKIYCCDNCDFTTENETEFQEHCNEHSEEKQKKYTCNYCSCIFETPVDLNNHTCHKNKLGEEHCCPYCEFKSDIADVAKHKDVIHLDKKKFACTECPMKFFNRFQLRFHGANCTSNSNLHHKTKKTNHSSQISGYVCKLCDIRFANKMFLKVHIRERHPHKVRVNSNRSVITNEMVIHKSQAK